ncbi:MAG TPA: peptidase [Gammaproteobacteria bacterium]|nr:peptidase [Gammaproteobacteria bacterium]
MRHIEHRVPARRGHGRVRAWHYALAALALLSVTAPLRAASLADGLIVRFTANTRAVLEKSSAGTSQLMQRLSTKTGLSLHVKRPMSGQQHVIKLDGPVDADTLDTLLQRLQQDPAIAHVEADYPIHPFAVPDDYFYPNQWPLHSAADVPAAMNLPAAWNTTTGNPETVVAVIDTGILPNHIDLDGRVLPGYDFIVGFEVGDNTLLEQYPSYMTYFRTNDGDGRDDDPTDPGDWVDIDDTYAMLSVGNTCNPQDSTFHGTGIASIIAANTDHAHGIAGIDWQARILPARVSGKCGGSRSDMIDAIRWAAGIEDPALPSNPYPARVINLSLGSNNACGFAEQAAINEAWAAGAVLVAAAGNDAVNLDSTPVAPASCENVIGVGAVREDGARAYYSNYGQSLTIAAPGGEDANSGGTPMVVASNRGVKAPVEGSHFRHVAGTSSAAAHVSGVLSLMVGANPALTPHQLRELLVQSARDFPDTGIFRCDTQTCGAGLVDAYTAVTAAKNGYVNGNEPPPISAAEGKEDDEPVAIETGVSGGASGNVSLFLSLIMLSVWLARRRTTTLSRT